MSSSGDVPLEESDRAPHDEEVLHEPTTSPPFHQRNSVFRAVRFLCRSFLFTFCGAAILWALLIGNISIGVGFALVNYAAMIPALIIIAAPNMADSSNLHPMYQILVQFFQAGMVGTSVVFAAGAIVHGVFRAVFYIWMMWPLTQCTEAVQEEAVQADSRVEKVRIAVVEKMFQFFLITPLAYIGVRVLWWYYGSGWGLLVCEDGYAGWQLVVAGIMEVIGKGIVTGFQYLCYRRCTRRPLEDAESAESEAVKLDSIVPDPSKPQIG